MARDFNTPPLPLDALTLHPRHHRAALWWLGWLYRNPDAFRDSLEQSQWRRATRAAMALYLHAVPWVFFILVASEMFLFHAGLANSNWAKLALADQWLAASR